jgi:hypothetical protein
MRAHRAADHSVQVSRAQRFPIQVPIRYRLRGETIWREGTAENVSRTGILFRAEDAPPPSSRVVMMFRLLLESGEPGAEISCLGEITRTEAEDGNHGPRAAAAMFLDYHFEGGSDGGA